MKKRKIFILAVVSTAFLLCGCTSGKSVYLESASETETAQNGTQQSTEQITEQIENTESTEKTKTEGLCYVHLCGAVKHPGIYILPEGSRIYEAVLLAGGLTEDAYEGAVNQAEVLTDGQMIRFLTEEEAKEEQVSDLSGNAAEIEDDGKVNLNTATLEELTTLPGIGESKAEAMIAYRNEHNGFSSIDEIKNIAGIKDGIFQRIKDKIKV